MPRTKKSAAKQSVNPMKSKSTDALTDAMPRTKKSSAKKRVEPPPDASLLGIAPELRNNIYHMVAQDIEEVSILSRKIGFGAASAEDRLWDTVAKHPLSQTCSQLRQEFDPIHRRKAITVGVTRYRLEVPNYDVYRLREFARLLKQVPSFVPQIRASVKVDRVLVRFQLDSNLKSSLDRIRQDLLTPDRLRKPFLKLRDHFLGESDDYDKRYDWDLDNRWYWWQGRCVVNLNMNDPNMPGTENISAPTLNLMKSTRKAFAEIHKHHSGNRTSRSSDGDYARFLHDVHWFAHAAGARKSTKDKLRPMLKAELTREIENEVEAKIRKQLKLSATLKVGAPKLRRCLQTELRGELKAELRSKIGGALEVEIRDELDAQTQARKTKDKEAFKKDLRGELKEELRRELKGELRDEIRGELEAELRQELKMK
jgi:hypothetical protein